MKVSTTVLERLIFSLPALREFHAPGCNVYEMLKQVACQEVEKQFSADTAEPRDFAPFGKLVFPFTQMGAISSLDLFGLDELIIFSFYWSNRGKYRRVLDLGANIGLHSIVLSRCGFEVRSYEPDPTHFDLLQRNLANNACSSVTPTRAAVSLADGTATFTRVLGNTTGSHLTGAKPSVYGDVEQFPVKLRVFRFCWNGRSW